MTKEEKIEMIAEDLSNDDIEEVKEDVRQWTDAQLDDYIYVNFQHGHDYAEPEI